MGSKEMLFLKSSLCSQQRNKKITLCEKARGWGGREAKERVEKKASLCCVAWLSTHFKSLQNDVLKSCRFNPSNFF